MEKTEFLRAPAEVGKPGGRNEFDDGKMLERRLEILAERKDVAIGSAQVLHGLHQFLLFFTKAQHEA